VANGKDGDFEGTVTEIDRASHFAVGLAVVKVQSGAGERSSPTYRKLRKAFPELSFLWTEGNGRRNTIETESTPIDCYTVTVPGYNIIFEYFKRQSE